MGLQYGFLFDTIRNNGPRGPLVHSAIDSHESKARVDDLLCIIKRWPGVGRVSQSKRSRRKQGRKRNPHALDSRRSKLSRSEKRKDFTWRVNVFCNNSTVFKICGTDKCSNTLSQTSIVRSKV